MSQMRSTERERDGVNDTLASCKMRNETVSVCASEVKRMGLTITCY